MLRAFAHSLSRFSSEPRDRPPSRVTRWHVFALALIVGASLAYRLYVSNECSLWLDEASTAKEIYSPWPKLLRGPEREHPPLMFVLVRLGVEIFGRGDTAVRAVSLLFGCVLLVGVYLLCLELGFRATRALVPVAWLALTPFFIRYTTEARQYAIVGGCTIFATLFALRLIRGPLKTSALVGLAVCSVAAAETQFFALPYGLALWGAVLVGTARRWDLRALPERQRRAVIVVGGASLLVFGALATEILLLIRFYKTHSLHGSAHHHLAPSAVWQQFSFLAHPPWDPAKEAIVAGCGLLLVLWRRRDMGGLVPLALTFPPIAAAHLLLSGGHMLTPRYLYPSFVLYQIGEASVLLALVELIELGVSALARVAHAGAFARPLAALGWFVLLVPLNARLSEFPSGFGAGGPVNYRGLQAYFRGARADDTALVVFVGYAGLRVMGTQYPVPHLLSLEDFEPIPGIERYVVAEFGSSDRTYQVKFGPLLREHLGISLKQWRAIRPLRLPGDEFQRGAPARLVIRDGAALAARQEDASRVPAAAAPEPDTGVSVGESSGAADESSDDKE
jgi:4-amino-4-deoxy-L-arabinose transferase-like glycosyltransferase